MATGKAKISLSFMQEAGRAETAGRQWDSGQAPAEKPCSGLGIFLAERHGQRGEDSWNPLHSPPIHVHPWHRNGRSERKKWMCLARSAEQAELGREGGEIDP